MIKTLIHIFLVLSISVMAHSQNEYFHKVFKLPSQNSTRPYNIKFLDSTYYLTGHVDGPSGVGVMFLHMDLSGEYLDTVYHTDSACYDFAGYSMSKLDTNNNGNFMLHYRNKATNGTNKHERLELNKNGQILYKNSLDTFVNLNMNYPDYSSLVFDNSNSTYYTNGAFDVDLNDYGIVTVKFSQSTNEVIWINKILSSGPLDGITRLKRSILLYENSDILVIFNAQKGQYIDSLGQQFSKTMFEKYNSNGTLLEQKVLSNDIYTSSGLGGILVNEDKELILCITKSQIYQNSSGWNYYGMTPTIAKLDSNFNIVWQKDIGGQYYNSQQLNFNRFVNDFVLTIDSAVVGASFYLELGADIDTNKASFLRLEKRNVHDGML